MTRPAGRVRGLTISRVGSGHEAYKILQGDLGRIWRRLKFHGSCRAVSGPVGSGLVASGGYRSVGSGRDGTGNK